MILAAALNLAGPPQAARPARRPAHPLAPPLTLECGDLSPLFCRRLVAVLCFDPRAHRRTHRADKSATENKSGDKSPHSKSDEPELGNEVETVAC